MISLGNLLNSQPQSSIDISFARKVTHLLLKATDFANSIANTSREHSDKSYNPRAVVGKEDARFFLLDSSHYSVNNWLRLKDGEGERGFSAIEHASVNKVWADAGRLDVARMSLLSHLVTDGLVAHERTSLTCCVVGEHRNAACGCHRGDCHDVTPLLFNHSWQELFNSVEVRQRINRESALDHLV